MPIDPDYAPSDAAPETGIYELLTMMGSPSRTREHIKAGARCPRLRGAGHGTWCGKVRRWARRTEPLTASAMAAAS